MNRDLEKALYSAEYIAPIMRLSLSRSALTRVQASVLIVVVLAGAGLAIYGYSVSSKPARTRLIVSTTTSLYETGFLDYLKSKFELKYPNMNVSFISQGTGLAIQTAMRGDADMLLVHAPSQEYPFLKGGYGVNRKIVAYNFFVIVGPSEDLAGIKGKSPSDALKAIRSAGLNGTAIWVSRGDNSGTYTKEVSLWSSAGLDVKKLRQEKWYLEAGSGMTATLKLANEKRGYTLSDTASYLLNFNNHNIDLVKLIEAQKSMLNVYSAIADDPRNANMTKTNFQGSMQLIRYLVSDEGQQLFADYGVSQYGKPLFGPYLKLLQTKSDLLGNDPAQLIQWISAYAFFEGSECPQQFRYQAEGLYSMQAPVPVLLVSILTEAERSKTPAWIRSLKA
jgi:tungstate transport system substrate-binding protein